MKSKLNNISRRILRYFLQGVLIIAPTGITIYIVYLIFTYIDGYLRSLIVEYIPYSIPGLGILLSIIVIALLGFLGQTIFFRPIRRLIDNILKNVPLVKVLYSSIRDLFSAFVGQEKKFSKPVLVKVNTISELEKIGFITTEDMSELGIKNKVAVYFPHSYNFSGELFIVPREHVTALNITSAEAMKFIVSGGITKV